MYAWKMSATPSSASRTLLPYRPLIDEIHEPREPPAIVLKHYDCHVGEVADTKGLGPREMRHVVRRVLEARRVLQENGFIHTGGLSSLTAAAPPVYGVPQDDRRS